MYFAVVVGTLPEKKGVITSYPADKGCPVAGDALQRGAEVNPNWYDLYEKQ